MIVHYHGSPGEGHGLLGYVVSGIRFYGFFSLGELFLGGLGPEHYSVSSGFIRGFYDQLLYIVEHILSGLVLLAYIRRYVRDHGIFPEIVLYYLLHVGVYYLVVGHPSSGSISYGDVSSLVGAENPRNSQHGIRAEHLRIEEVVVYPSVYDVHFLKPLGSF